MARVRLDLDAQTFSRLVETAVAEQRPTDWQAEVILARALGTWEEGRTDYNATVTSMLQPVTDTREVEHATT